MATMDALATEVIIVIVEYLGADLSSINAFARTNDRHYAIANRMLYAVSLDQEDRGLMALA